MKLDRIVMAVLLLGGCSSETGTGLAERGGQGAGGSGGSGGSGGKTTATGGDKATGGSSSSSSGQSGGATGTGGKTETGGSGAGGAGAGGASAAGGVNGRGGATTGSGGVGSGGSTVPTGNGGTTAAGGRAGSDGGPGSGGAVGSGGAGPGGAGGSLPWLKVVGNQVQIEATGRQVILRGISLQGIGTQNNVAAIDYLTNTNDTAGSSPGWYPKMLRLPVDTPNPNQYINSTLKPAVDYCTKKGLYCIVDLHYVANPYQNDAAVKSFWTIVAPMFKDYSNVIYEIYNESSVQDSWATYKPTMQAWVNLVRSFAPKNIIFAGSPSWDQTLGDIGTNGLTGENIVYVVHMYEEHFVNPNAGFTQWTGNNTIKAQVERCARYHPVVMTEWGFNSEASQPGRGTDIIGHYGRPILEWLEGLGGGWTAWCASSSWLPRMFTGGAAPNWVLRVGQDNEGGFVKDWLYTHRNDKSPF